MKPVKEWGAPMPGSVLVCLILLVPAQIALWGSLIAPALLQLTEALRKADSFACDFLANVSFVLGILPWFFGPPLIAAYLVQRRWDRLHISTNSPS